MFYGGPPGRELGLRWLASPFMELSVCSQVWAGLPFPRSQVVLGGVEASLPWWICLESSLHTEDLTLGCRLSPVPYRRVTPFKNILQLSQSQAEWITKNNILLKVHLCHLVVKTVSVAFKIIFMGTGLSLPTFYLNCEPFQILCSGAKTKFLFWIVWNKDNFLS